MCDDYDDYDDYDDVEFAESELCALCSEPFVYVGRSAHDSDICSGCENDLTPDDYI